MVCLYKPLQDSSYLSPCTVISLQILPIALSLLAFWECLISLYITENCNAILFYMLVIFQVAEYLVPRVRKIVGENKNNSTYTRYLTGFKAYTQILAVSFLFSSEFPALQILTVNFLINTFCVCRGCFLRPEKTVSCRRIDLHRLFVLPTFYWKVIVKHDQGNGSVFLYLFDLFLFRMLFWSE